MTPSPHLSGLKYLAPEIAILVAASIALLAHVFMPRKGHRIAGILSFAGLAAGAALLFVSPHSPGELFSGHLIGDRFAFFFKAVVLLSTALVFLLSFRFFDVEKSEPGEVYYLILLSIAGMMLAVSAVDLVTTYVSFELFAIPSYVLAGIFKKEKRPAEAGIKYFFLGTLSSGIMLLGMALVFGLTGETNYAEIARSIPGANEPIVLTGMILFFAGIFFKATMVPFHMWAPDVYEGAATPVTVYISTAPKAAVFAILIRLMLSVFGRFEVQWTQVFQWIALVTMFWGNIAALTQKNIKRMMAYSSIAHAGYIAIGLAAWGEMGSLAVLFYIFVYVFMNAAAFGLALFSRKGTGFGEDIDDLRGLARKSPLSAAAIIIILLSLTGIPPTAGFIGKYLLFAAAVEKGLVWLAVAGALNSVISLFYYFRIGKAMFMEEAPADGSLVERSAYTEIVLGTSAVVVLVFGILPSLLAAFAASSRL
jgi:NADH-quinone oxidoreductase subunit N